MTAPEPRANPRLIGHAAAEAVLVQAMRSGRLHHAWLMTGPEGVGKATLAFRFARRLLAGPAPDDTLALDATHPVFHRVAAGTHADLLTVQREWDEKKQRFRGVIVVEAVRRVPDFLALTPAEGGWRVVVVDGAEEMNPSAANALLKVLEEPPPRALILLVSSAPGRLLPTIRSRCRRLRLAPLDDTAMAALLAEYLPDLPAPDRAGLIRLAEGSPGRALLLAEDQGIALAALADEVLRGLPTLPKLHGHEVADALGRRDTAFGTFMDLLRAGIARAVRQAARGTADAEQARLASLRPLDAWCDVWQGLTQLQADTERFNLDKRQAVLSGLALLGGE